MCLQITFLPDVVRWLPQAPLLHYRMPQIARQKPLPRRPISCFGDLVLQHPSPSVGIKFRLAAFSIAIAVMVAIIAATAHNAWRRGGELRERLTAVQLKSFQIADHLQETILELNNSVLRYGAYRDTNAWAHFQIASRELDRWIDDQRAVLATDSERRLLDLINTNYDFYIAAA